MHLPSPVTVSKAICSAKDKLCISVQNIMAIHKTALLAITLTCFARCLSIGMDCDQRSLKVSQRHGQTSTKEHMDAADML